METDFDISLPPLPCNVSAINQVLLIPQGHKFRKSRQAAQLSFNLIVNAVHAIAEVNENGRRGKGKIFVQTRNLGEWAEIRVGDTGGGIPKNIRNRIFDPFFTTKTVGKGTGQVLSITRTIAVEAHHGSITFAAELGHGTPFIV